MLRNVATVFVADLTSKVLLAVAALLLIRVMSPGEYASFTAAAAVFAVVYQAAGAAFSRVYLVTQGANPVAGHAATFLSAQLLTALAIALLGTLLVDLPPLLLAGTVWLALAGCSTDFLKTVYQTRHEFGSLSAVELVRSTAFLSAIVVALSILGTSLPSWVAIALQAAAFSAASVPLVRLLGATAGSSPRLPVGALFAQISSRPLVYLVGYFLALAVLSSTDVFMLRALSDDETLATYGSAFRYYSLILVALYALNTVMLPVMQKAADAKSIRAVLRGHRIVLFIALPAITIMTLTAYLWIPLIDAGKYPQAIVTFRILAFSATISILCSPWVNLFLLARRYSELLPLVVLALATALVGNALLIPAYGAQGAALATLASSGVLNIGIALRGRTIRDSV